MAGRFRLGARIGQQPDCHRYEAWDEHSSRWVQLVVRLTPTVRDARFVHPGIAQREDVGCIGEWFVSVLDPGPGEALPRLLGRLGGRTPLDLESLVIIGLGLCEALTHIGRWGLIHGDLGTQGLFVSPQLDPILLDLPVQAGGRLSQASVPFASPERLLGHEGDPRSDVYSIGALLYTLRVGRPPFGWSENAAREGHFYSPVEAHPQLPEPIMEVLQSAMEKPPRLRYPDPASFAIALTDAYQLAAGAWTDEEIPGVGGDVTEEVALLETHTARQVRFPATAEDPGTTWESFTQSEPLDLSDADDDLMLRTEYIEDLEDKTIELGPELLENAMLAAEFTPRFPTQTRSPQPILPRPAEAAYPAPAPPPPTPAYAQRPEPINRPQAHHRLPDSLGLDPYAADDVHFEEPWIDTLVPARSRELLEDENLPLMVLAAICSLVVGMAGAATVLAFLLAQLTL